MPTVVRKSRPKASANVSAAVSRIREMLIVKAIKEQHEKREKALKEQIHADLQSLGEEDDQGHAFFDLPEPVEAGGSTYTRIKRQKAVTTSFDEDVAKRILAKKVVEATPGDPKHSLLDECQTTIVVLDEQKIREAHFEGKITKAEIERMFPKSITYSIRPLK